MPCRVSRNRNSTVSAREVPYLAEHNDGQGWREQGSHRRGQCQRRISVPGAPSHISQQHRGTELLRDKRATKPMLNFKSFHSAASVIADIELMHMTYEGQFHARTGMFRPV